MVIIIILVIISTRSPAARHSSEEEEQESTSVVAYIFLEAKRSEAMDGDFDDFLNSVASPPAKATTETSRGQETTTPEKLENSNYDLDFLNDSPTSTLATGATVS